MLVLSRKVGESIVINDTIQVTIVEIDRNKIRLGFIAPMDTVIDRQEVHERKQLGIPSPKEKAQSS